MAQAAAAMGVIQSSASKVGTQREYETVVILRPDTAKPQINEFITRFRKIFGERGGTLIKIDSWGIRVLAYPIKHQRKGLYLYWRYLGGSDMVAEFERVLRLSDRTLRFYTVRVDEDVDPEARPSEVTDDVLEAVSEPGPDPDDVARERAAAEAARREAEAAAEAERRAHAAKNSEDDDEYENDLDNDVDNEDEE